MATPAVYAATLDAFLGTLITDAQVHASASARGAARTDEANGLDRDGAQVAFAVDRPDDFQLLERALDKASPRRAANYLAHTFDTDDATLRRAGYRVQLIEEPERFLISVVKASVTQEVELIYPREQHSAKIDGGWGAKILAGQLSPISVIDRRIRHPIAAELRALTADRNLTRVESNEHKSLRLGPVEFSEAEESASIYLEFDCAEAPGAEAAYRVIASGLGGETQSVGRLLGAWRKRAGVRRQIERLGSAQLAGLGNPAQVSGAVCGIESSSITPVND
jgi:hypothetical protein